MIRSNFSPNRPGSVTNDCADPRQRTIGPGEPSTFPTSCIEPCSSVIVKAICPATPLLRVILRCIFHAPTVVIGD